MAQRKGGYLGWIVAAGAFIAWLGAGHEDRIVVSPLPVSASLPTFRSTQNALNSAPPAPTAAEPAPTVEVPITRETPLPTAPQSNVRPNKPTAGRTMSTMINLHLRSSEATDSPIVATLNKGTEVEVIGSAGDQLQVTVPSLNITGWVRKYYLAESYPAVRLAPAKAATQQTPPEPAGGAPKLIPRHSKPTPGTPIRAPVTGSCDCPYDYTRNGSHCGGRSAYSRPGGRSPSYFYE